ncbi:MAG: M14 family zinc carboxypeptidase [Proteobacteria bacterium]|nr:M14 family zinc carboxypeptidase [Pseudomonadota bacterium]
MRPAALLFARTSFGLALCTTAVLAIAHLAAPAPTQIRVAIRVDCTRADTCALVDRLALDVWSEDRGAGLPLDVVVDAADLGQFAPGMYEVLVPDIDAVAAAERARLARPAAATAEWSAEYHDYTAITAHLHALAAASPDLATVHAIGNSLENRPIWALRIGGTAPGGQPMLVNGTQHAREWIASAVTTCVADRLLAGYASDPAIRAFVDHTALWVVPVVNPDGYQYSWSTDRYWRKNRRERHGVDLNRNFALAFGNTGSSGNKRAQDYRGPHAFSEPESAALRDLALREHVAAHIDFHAYSQLVLYPWNHTDAPAADRDRFAAIGDRMASAMFAPHETRYALMSGIELYPAAGTMSDWMYGEAGALSYTIELRPKGGRGLRGFVLPPEQIAPTCDEGLAAVLTLRAAL